MRRVGRIGLALGMIVALALPAAMPPAGAAADVCVRNVACTPSVDTESRVTTGYATSGIGDSCGSGPLLTSAAGRSRDHGDGTFTFSYVWRDTCGVFYGDDCNGRMYSDGKIHATCEGGNAVTAVGYESSGPDEHGLYHVSYNLRVFPPSEVLVKFPDRPDPGVKNLRLSGAWPS